MEQRSKYQLRQPRESLDPPLFFIDLAAARRNEQMDERQYGRIHTNERPPAIFADARRIERPTPRTFTQYSNSTRHDQSNIEEEKYPAADKRNPSKEIVKKKKNKRKRSSRCCRSRGNSRSNQSFDSCICCCFYSNNSNCNESIPNQADDSDNCCDCQNCCECDCGSCDGCGDCDCGGCDGCGDFLGACCGILFACCAVCGD